MKKYRTVWMMLLQWGVIWTLIVWGSLLWNQSLIQRHLERYIYKEASTVLNKDLAFRHWATLHGGVYVHPTDQTPPNPWLTIPKRDVVTLDGDRLTLMNPAYVARQVMTLFSEQFGIKGHITSLYLKNPNNAPDDWELRALWRFEKGEKEVSTLVDINGQPHFRLIRAMRMEQGCLKCHADTGIRLGGIRGGVSVAVPLTSHIQEAAKSSQGVLYGHGIIWLVGMFGIGAAAVHSWRQQQREQRAEEQLRSQEALYASLASASPTGIFQTDSTGSCCYVNERWSIIAGMAADRARNQGWISAIHPDDQQLVSNAWQRSVQERSPFKLEYRLMRPDGSISWVYGQSAAVIDKNGTIGGYVGTITDITSLKQAESDLRDTMLFLSESQTIARVAGWKANPTRKLMDWTDEMYRILECPIERPVNYDECYGYFDPQDIPVLQRFLQDAFETGAPFRLNCRMTTATGRRFWADFRCVGRLDGADGPYIAGILQDISEYKQIEELLTDAKEQSDAASRTKTELLATISHELRTPLNGVMGGIQLLELTELTDEQAEYLAMVRSSADNELVLVNDLLDLAGLEASGVRIDAAPFRLIESIELAVTLHRTELSGRGLELFTNLPDELQQQVVGDSKRLTQIVSNLLGNAIKFTEQGSITLAASVKSMCDDLMLEVVVSDTGIGINLQDQERIFEPFVQADMSSTRRFGGSGLGLSICKRLAEKMAGSIRVTSKPGEGSTFVLSLPLRKAVGGPEVQQDSEISLLPDWDGPSLTVLIAEDNQINLKAAASLLAKMGFNIICAEDGKDALGHWLQGGIDLVLMDVQMPVMDGIEATRLIRQHEQLYGAHTPIIALTAHAMSGDRERLIVEGFDGYVAKPLQLSELLSELRRVIQSSRRASWTARTIL